MKYFNVCSLKEYEENGETKRKWYRVGYIKETQNGGRYLVLFHQPDVTLYIFENKEEENLEN
jgi:hypothetical protein